MKRIFLAVTAATLLASGVVSAAPAQAELSPAHSHWDVHSYTNHEIQFCYDPTAIDPGAGNTLAFMPLREQDAQNFMQLNIQRDGFALQKRVNGTLSTVSPSFSTSGLGHGVGNDIMVDFVMAGSTYTLYQLNRSLSRGAELYQWHDSTYSVGVNISYYTEPYVAGTWDFVHAFPIDGGIGEPHDIFGLHQDATNHDSVTGLTTFDDPTPADGGATDITTSSTFGLPSGAKYVYKIRKTGSTGNGSFDFRDPGDSGNELFFQNSYYRFRTDQPGGKATLQRFNGSTPGTTYTASSGGPGTYTLSLQGSDMYVKDSSGRVILHVNDGGPQSGLRVRVMPASGESWTWSGKRGSGSGGSVSAGQTSAVRKEATSSTTLHGSGSCAVSPCTAWLRDSTGATSLHYDSQGVPEGKAYPLFTTPGTGSRDVQVASAPTGPVAPGSRWHVAYADAFGGTLHNRATGSVTGDDNTWLYDGGTPGTRPGFNSDEVEVFNPGQISERSDGLHETCKYTPGVASGKNGSPLGLGVTHRCGSATWMRAQQR
jgi:hypothetical protein